MIIKKNYCWIVVLFCCSNIAMDDHQNNENQQYYQLLQKILLLPIDIVVKIEKNLYLVEQYDIESDFLSVNHQDLTIKNGQLANRVVIDSEGKWQQVENGYPQALLSFEKTPVDEADWFYDGPNKNNKLLVVATTRKQKSSSLEEEKSILEYTSLLYLSDCQPVIKFVRLSRELPHTNITALALAHKTNRRAIASFNAPDSEISLFNEEGNELKKVTLDRCFIKRLIMLPHLLYALSEQADVYAIDFASGQKTMLQIFKDATGQNIKIDDFAIDMQCPSRGALISQNKLYCVDVVRKRFKELAVPELHLPGMYQLKICNGKIGICMRHTYNQYKLYVINQLKMPSLK